MWKQKYISGRNGRNAHNASQAEKTAELSGDQSEIGSHEINYAIEEIRQVETVVTDAALQLTELGHQAAAISSIVSVIKEVADQTNLLALNAAIEAARAGENGRGFAVVADEVRKLAERTSSSALEITSTIGAIQNSTQASSRVMSQGSDLVTQSVQKIESAGVTMQQIRDSANRVIDSVSEISTTLLEQKVAGATIANNVEQIAQMTEANNRAISVVSTSAHDLKKVAAELNLEVEKFTV